MLAELDADTGTIHLVGDDGLLHLMAHAGGIPEHLLPIIQRIPVGKGIAGLAVERLEPVDMCNLQTDTSGDARPGAKATGVKGSICVPMMKDGRAVGALGVATAREREFTSEETARLMAVGEVLADTL
jgi:L-methionine (R)-S-oxide reductase